eukprot:4281102-Pleurochrysis_carterae.AAC.1
MALHETLRQWGASLPAEVRARVLAAGRAASYSCCGPLSNRMGSCLLRRSVRTARLPRIGQHLPRIGLQFDRQQY